MRDLSRFAATGPPSIRWSLFAGIYMFACAAVTAVGLAPILTVLAETIGLPVAYASVVLASPALLTGAAAWWLVVERQGTTTYLRGGVFGLITALLTGLFWTVRFVLVWGVALLTADLVPVLVAVVLGIALVAGVLTALPLMYARRRLHRDPTGEPGSTV